jgi:hypothetical protein
MSESTQTQAQREAQRLIFEAEALAVPKEHWKSLQMGMGDYLKETRDIVDLAKRYWEPGPDDAPPFKIARSKFSFDKLTRFEGLLDALQYVHAQEVATVNPSTATRPLVKRAQYIINELYTALSFVLQDDPNTITTDKLSSLQAAKKSANARAATQGQLLLSWGLFAQDQRTLLTQLDDFNFDLIAEATTLGTTLTSATPTITAERSDLRTLRLGLYTLAYAEMQALRQAASYAYRHHPDIKRRFFSAIERNQRTQRRLQSSKKSHTKSPSTPDTTS